MQFSKLVENTDSVKVREADVKGSVKVFFLDDTQVKQYLTTFIYIYIYISVRVEVDLALYRDLFLYREPVYSNSV